MEVAEERLTLVRKRVAALSAVDRVILQDCTMTAEATMSMVADQLWFTIRGYVLGEEMPSHTESCTRTITIEHPASWWDHFKHQHGGRWFMRRLVRRWPARMQVKSETGTWSVTWENMAAYPFARLRSPTPDYLGQAVRIGWRTVDYKEVPNAGE